MDNILYLNIYVNTKKYVSAIKWFKLLDHNKTIKKYDWSLIRE